MPTPPSLAWNEISPADNTNISLGDDRIREFKQDVRERAQNGGHFYPTSGTNAFCGVHVIDTVNKVSGEFSVYSMTAGVPLSKIFTLTTAATTINTNTVQINGALDCSGAITQGGVGFLKTTSLRKFIVTLVGDDTTLKNQYFSIPQGLVNVTLTGFTILRRNTTNSISDLFLYKVPLVWAAGGGDEATVTDTTVGGASLFTTNAFLTGGGGGHFGARTDAFTIPTLAVDDILGITWTGIFVGQLTAQITFTADSP